MFLKGHNIKMKTQILELLAALCVSLAPVTRLLSPPPDSPQLSCWLSEDGLRRTLSAFDKFKAERKETIRFQTLVKSIESGDEMYKVPWLFEFVRQLPLANAGRLDQGALPHQHAGQLAPRAERARCDARGVSASGPHQRGRGALRLPPSGPASRISGADC